MRDIVMDDRGGGGGFNYRWGKEMIDLDSVRNFSEFSIVISDIYGPQIGYIDCSLIHDHPILGELRLFKEFEGEWYND